jgi:uncharacterized membrane protein
MTDPHPKRRYNAIAGTSVERLAALSDGVFAVAMTLLVLELHAPPLEAVHSELDLWNGLVHLAPRLMVWAMSFLTLGIFWVGQQTQLNHLERSNRDLKWIHLGFLLAVSMIPFSTSLLGQFPSFRNALLVYWLNILALGTMLYLSWVCAVSGGIVKADMPAQSSDAIKRRIVIAQALYAAGAALAFVDTRWSIALIVLVQLNYVFAFTFSGRGGSA